MPALSDEVFCAELLRRTFIAVEENGVLKSSLDEANGKLIELYKTLESLKQENIILQNAIISHQEQFTSQSLELETVSRALDSAKQKESASLAQIDAQQHQLIEASKSRQYTDATVQARLTLAPVIRTMRASRQGSLRRAASAPPGARSSTGCGETSRPSRPRKQAIRIPAVRKATSTLTAKPTPSSSDVQIPEARRMVLQAFTAVSVPESSEQIVTFTRRELSTKLGGSMQGVDGTFGRSKPLATTHDLHGCIFPQRQTNPWLPASPGDHGYMFVGLKGPFKDDERFREPTTRALFIPEGKSGWRYYGLYVIQRKPENDLTVDEWNGFPDKFKDGREGYCDTTLSKRLGQARHGELVKHSRSEHELQLEKIRADYDAGTLRVPCVVLQCVAYNEQLVNDLLGAHAKAAASKAQSKDGPGEPAVLGKRKRKLWDPNNTTSPPSSSPQRARLM